jgi:hypothetical protein
MTRAKKKAAKKKGPRPPSGDEWCTPKEIWEPASVVLGGGIGLTIFDPFPNAKSRVPFEAYAGCDGFAHDWFEWTMRRRAFVNPPFSRAGEAVRKCVAEWMAGVDVVAVIPCGLNASHWECIDLAPAVCRPFRRVAFEVDGVQVRGNRQDVVIAYWGGDPWRFREAFRSYGAVRLQ